MGCECKAARPTKAMVRSCLDSFRICDHTNYDIAMAACLVLVSSRSDDGSVCHLDGQRRADKEAQGQRGNKNAWLLDGTFNSCCSFWMVCDTHQQEPHGEEAHHKLAWLLWSDNFDSNCSPRLGRRRLT